MKTHRSRFLVRLAAATGVVSLLAGTVAGAEPPSPDSRAATVGAALPGGAVISAHSVILTPTAGGDSTAVPIAANGAFSAAGLAPGRYTLRVASVSVSRQTQGASFGEKVNQGLHAAGGALATGAQATAPTPSGAPGMDAEASPRREKIIHRDIAARMPTTVAIGNQPLRAIDVDGDGIAVEAMANGVITGIVVGAIGARP